MENDCSSVRVCVNSWNDKYKELEKNRRKMNEDLLYLSLKSLVEICQNSCEYIKEHYSYKTKFDFAKQFGTVKLCTARGAGHTSSIAKLIEEKFNKVVLIFHIESMKRLFLERFPDLETKVHICSANTLYKLQGIGDYEAVIVDCTSFISESKIEQIYRETSIVMNKPLYIFME